MANRDEVLQLALQLSAEDRAHLAALLRQSLTGDEHQNGKDLLAELERGSAAYRSGAMTARPALEVIEELRTRRLGGGGAPR